MVLQMSFCIGFQLHRNKVNYVPIETNDCKTSISKNFGVISINTKLHDLDITHPNFGSLTDIDQQTNCQSSLLCIESHFLGLSPSYSFMEIEGLRVS